MLQSLELNAPQGASSDLKGGMMDGGMQDMINSLEEPNRQNGSEWQNVHELGQTGGAMTHAQGMDGLLESLALVEEPTISEKSQPVEAQAQVGGGRKRKHADLEAKIKKLVLRKQKKDDKYLKEGNIRKLIQQYLTQNSSI